TAPRVIDAFFRELASVWQHNAVGIILSGTGSDGTLGLKAIRAAGGLILVQNPDTAEFDGMPRAAVRGALPDDVLDTRELANTLRNHLQQGLPLSAPRAEASADAELPSAQGVDDDTLSNALEMLRNNGEHDFRRHTPNMLQRRIQRRMGLVGATSNDSYLQILEQNSAERARLAEDFLISVTDFFREPESFDSLKEQIRAMLRDRDVDDT